MQTTSRTVEASTRNSIIEKSPRSTSATSTCLVLYVALLVRPHNGQNNLKYTATIKKEKLPYVVECLNYLVMVWSYEVVATLMHANKKILKCLIGLAVWSRAMIILLTDPNAKTARAPMASGFIMSPGT